MGGGGVAKCVTGTVRDGGDAAADRPGRNITADLSTPDAMAAQVKDATI